jgi:hypothetical protein
MLKIMFSVVTNGIMSMPNLISLMVEAANTSETSVNYQTTRRSIPEDSHLHTRRRENLKSHLIKYRPTDLESWNMRTDKQDILFTSCKKRLTNLETNPISCITQIIQSFWGTEDSSNKLFHKFITFFFI